MNDEAAAVHWTVYMLECADKTLYTGITNDLDRRMAEHEAGKGARYTKGRGPFRLVYQETCAGQGGGLQAGNRDKITEQGKKAAAVFVKRISWNRFGAHNRL